MTITLTPETEARLRARAERERQDIDALADALLAEALSEDIVIDTGELDGARWFSREEAALMIARTHPEGFTAPVPVAIAYHIIRAWVENGVEFR